MPSQAVDSLKMDNKDVIPLPDPLFCKGVADIRRVILRVRNRIQRRYQEYLLLDCRVTMVGTSIGLVNNTNEESITIYDLHGRRVGSEARGVLILRQTDGTTRKIFR